MRNDLIPKSFNKKLARLNEECAEVIKAVSKIQRFGRKAQDPKTKIKYDNVQDLQNELKDLIHAINDIQDKIRNG